MHDINSTNPGLGLGVNKELDKITEIVNIIHDNGHYPVLPEIIAWALHAMKRNPHLSVSDAMKIGFSEWVK